MNLVSVKSSFLLDMTQREDGPLAHPNSNRDAIKGIYRIDFMLLAYSSYMRHFGRMDNLGKMRRSFIDEKVMQCC